MRRKIFLIVFCTFFVKKSLCWHSRCDTISLSVDCRLKISDTICVGYDESQLTDNRRPSPLLQLFRIKHKKHKKLTATLLAFPFPFGIVGLHRIYLGCAPYIPVVYIASLGGAFGVLPFIDFCVLLLDKNTEGYVNNNKVFMWVN